LFFDRPDSGELAVLVHLDLASEEQTEDPREFEELVLSAGGDPVTFVTGSRVTPSAKYFIGQGKLEELIEVVEQTEAEIVIFNHALSPSQERNLEAALECRVLDRTGLILDIFAQRARTHEGKLQVELAQLRHMSTRLIRGWTHLERQKGGIGLRGPGETQLETDRRLLRARISLIESKLNKVRKQREQGRRARQRASTPTVSLVGYTNAGKSTLFNALTNSDVYAADQLFATLDPTLRRIELDDIGAVILADTVGFIRHLPHRLVEAFRATLEEAANADLLIHVIDCASEERADNIEQVNRVLAEIGAGDLPVLEVYNKVDLLENASCRVDFNGEGVPVRVWLSAKEQQGFDQLLKSLIERLSSDIMAFCVTLAPSHARIRAQLHQANAVRDERYLENGDIELDVRIERADINRMLAGEPDEVRERFPVKEPVEDWQQHLNK